MIRSSRSTSFTTYQPMPIVTASLATLKDASCGSIDTAVPSPAIASSPTAGIQMKAGPKRSGRGRSATPRSHRPIVTIIAT